MLAKVTSFFLDLQATPLKPLWLDLVAPPPTKEGVLWHAAHAILEEKGKEKPCPEPKKKTNNSSKKSAFAKKTLPAAKSKVGGRKKGSKGWSKRKTDWLLNIVEVILPTGSNHWEKVALEHGEDYGDILHDADACKRKFECLTFTETSPGVSIPSATITRFGTQSRI